MEKWKLNHFDLMTNFSKVQDRKEDEDEEANKNAKRLKLRADLSFAPSPKYIFVSLNLQASDEVILSNIQTELAVITTLKRFRSELG